MKEIISKIVIRSIVIVILCGCIGFLVYLNFYASTDLRDLGYSESEISLLKKHGLDEIVTSYNPSLLYALTSNEFIEENMDYYLLIEAENDMTFQLNQLAELYSIEQLKTLKNNLTTEQLFDLNYQPEISNIDDYVKYLKANYDYTDAITLCNSITSADTDEFLKLGKISDIRSYLAYVKTGYPVTIVNQLFQKLEAADFSRLSSIRYLDDIMDYVNCDFFQIDRLARYYFYRNKKGATCQDSINSVNANKDIIAASDLDYSAMYTNIVTIEKVTTTTLINKSHQLTTDYIPANLTDVPNAYRNSTQQLTQETVDHFVEMAQALEEEYGITIQASNNYHSYAQESSIYGKYYSASGYNAAQVDSFAFKAGHSEHQSGLAMDICEKSNSYIQFEKSQASSWLKDNAYKYGFILRYQQGKEYLTGITSNAYHYRYVGKEAAEIIHTYDWTLEEYNYLYVGE